ncbi:hypothetical protein CEXT_288441 [Caerostris extrusa]|uniref:Uncharacterized protein n=1 Tax=Caerostris extrusa TaxID=172846 RepID=A0AAV4VEV4_CAEEX|nr:hypothetical protein CEXT_288441 [Caerostris extrusa]
MTTKSFYYCDGFSYIIRYHTPLVHPANRESTSKETHPILPNSNWKYLKPLFATRPCAIDQHFSERIHTVALRTKEKGNETKWQGISHF